MTSAPRRSRRNSGSAPSRPTATGAAAIRGALCHWIEVKDGKIKNYQIIAPTTWNVGPRDGKGIRGPIEEALMGAPIADPSDPVEVGHVARSFDSCLVCTVHAHDAKTGRELARFRTA